MAACTDKAGSTARRLKALPFAVVAQDGDDGANVVFPVDRFEEVAEIMRPRRRRRLSPEAREAARVRLLKYRFGAAAQVPKTGLGTPPEGPEGK